ncbi:hypothetical protein MTO96_036539 [Rhipicephalus appendiculatus]
MQYLRNADKAVRRFTPVPQGSLTWQDATEECRRVLLAFLWYAGNKATFRSVAQLFGMAESTLLGVVDRVEDFLEAVAPLYLKMPRTEEKKQQTSACFEAVCMYSEHERFHKGQHRVRPRKQR